MEWRTKQTWDAREVALEVSSPLRGQGFTQVSRQFLTMLIFNYADDDSYP
jgi:hypothetical protein